MQAAGRAGEAQPCSREAPEEEGQQPIPVLRAGVLQQGEEGGHEGHRGKLGQNHLTPPLSICSAHRAAEFYYYAQCSVAA